MKKLLGLVVLISAFQPLFAANLNIKVAGTSKENTYFLCVNHSGCMSMYAAAHGKTFPVDAGKIDRIFMVNAKNFQLYPQTLPASCAVNVNDNQTLVVSGKISKRANGETQISNMSCHVG